MVRLHFYCFYLFFVQHLELIGKENGVEGRKKLSLTSLRGSRIKDNNR
jgi:hypothetical protein